MRTKYTGSKPLAIVPYDIKINQTRTDRVLKYGIESKKKIELSLSENG